MVSENGKLTPRSRLLATSPLSSSTEIVCDDSVSVIRVVLIDFWTKAASKEQYFIVSRRAALDRHAKRKQQKKSQAHRLTNRLGDTRHISGGPSG